MLKTIKKFFVSMTVLPLWLTAAPVYADWSSADMNRQIDQTNFLVNRGCSGTLVDAKLRYILTADHCIKDQYEVVTRDKIKDDGRVEEEKVRIARPGTVSQKTFAGPNEIQQNSYVFKIVAADNKLDLALLKVLAKLPADSAVTMSCNDPGRGDTVYAVGNSFAVLYSSVSKGLVASTQRNYRDLQIAGDLGEPTDDGEHGLVQHTAVIAPGNSGGALYDAKGHFVGVNVRGIPGGFGFAVPLADIKSFLMDNHEEILFSQCTP